MLNSCKKAICVVIDAGADLQHRVLKTGLGGVVLKSQTAFRSRWQVHHLDTNSCIQIAE